MALFLIFKHMGLDRRAVPLAAVALLTTAITVFCSSCSRSTALEAEPTHQAAIPSIAVAKAMPEDLSRDLLLTAEFKPFQEIDVMAKVAGYVSKIYVDAGDHVRQGQLLATLEVPEMADDAAKAQAAVDRSQAEITHAKDEIRRAESAHQIAHISYERLAAVSKQRPGLIAQQEIDDAQSRDLVTEAQVSAAKSNLEAVMQQATGTRADQRRVKTLFDYTRVTAPFTGVVTKRYANTGSMIQAGTASQTQAMPVVRLSENSLLRLILPVPESVVPSIHVGQQVEVRVSALNRTFPGKVARSADKVQSSTRTMDTEVDVPNPGNVIVPGMYAEVDLRLDNRRNVLSVPVSAVDPDSDSNQERLQTGRVMVVTAANRLEPRKVALGLETARLVEVRSGLANGDMVVVGSRAGLQAGELVRPKLTTVGDAKEAH